MARSSVSVCAVGDADIHRVQGGGAFMVIQLGMILVYPLGAEQLGHGVAALLNRVGDRHHLYIVKLHKMFGMESLHDSPAAYKSQTNLIHCQTLPPFIV